MVPAGSMLIAFVVAASLVSAESPALTSDQPLTIEGSPDKAASETLIPVPETPKAVVELTAPSPELPLVIQLTSENVERIDSSTVSSVTATQFGSKNSSEEYIPLNCNEGLGTQGEVEVTCKGFTLSVGRGWARVDCFPYNEDAVVWESIIRAAHLRNRTSKAQLLETLAVQLCPAPPAGALGALISALGVPQGKGPSALILSFTRGEPPVLGPMHLAGFNDIRRLDLNTNQMVELHPELATAVPELRQLMLRSNKITLFPGIFANFSNLEVLELGMNMLTEVPPGTFRGLDRLRLLNLWGNRITTIGRASLRGASALENLDLSNNPLSFISPDLLVDVPNLQRLRLDNVRLSYLPSGLFAKNPRLKVFYFITNTPETKFPPGLLANLREVKDVRIMLSRISSLPDDSFTYATSLENLTLSKTLLTELPESLLSTTLNLKRLDLSSNRINFSEQQSPFSSLSRLIYLDLSGNRISHLSNELLEPLVKLELLKLNGNLISTVDSHAFDGMLSLKTLALGQNKLTDMSLEVASGTSALNKLIRLEVLDLSNNSISTIADDWRLRPSLKKLDLSNNSFTTISFFDFMLLGSGPVVDLRNNKIETVKMDEAQTIAFVSYVNPLSGASGSPPVRVLLSGNPLSCDCRNYDLALYARYKMIPEVYALVNLELPGKQCSDNQSLAEKDLRLFVCRVTEECPIGCRCFYRPVDLTLAVDCSGSGLKDTPRLPHYPLALHLELDLSNNNLPLFNPPSDAGYNATTRLFLSNNSITSLNFSQLNISRIEMLDLDGNNLTGLDKRTLTALGKAKRLTRLTLHKNPWQCNCSALPFLQYVQQHISLITDAQESVCHNGPAKGQRLVTAADGEACPGLPWAVWASAIIAASIATTLAAIWIRARDRLRLWLFARGLLPSGFCLGTEDPEDEIKPYDAFISFSHGDLKFVENELVPTLENGQNGLRLCLHYRDWIVGDLIPDQIVRSVADSRRTVVILSPSFLTSVWGRMEFRVAYKQALAEGRQRLVVVIYGDVDLEKDVESKELKAYLETNTYIRRDDPWFWERLRYALRRKGKRAAIPRRPHAPPILLCPPDKQHIIDASIIKV